MASFKQYTASGGASEAFSIPSFSSDEIKVYVDGVLKTATTHYNITSYTVNGGTVTWTAGNVPNGVVVRIVRDTDVSTARATYSAGSSIKAGDLNDNQTQALRALEEDDHLIQGYDFEDGVITAAKLASNSVTTAKITDANVTTAKIAADAITGAKIADDAINSEHYTDGSIDTAHIADLNVTTAKIAADAITGAKIADDAIDSEHYTDGSIDTAHIADSQVTTAKIAADAITGAKIADDAIDSEHYTDGSIDTAHIGDSQITTAKITDANVTTAKIAADAITGAKIADDAIDSEHYTDGSIDTAHIAAAQVTAAKLASNSVETSKITDANVTTAKIADDAITIAKIGCEQTTISDSDSHVPTSGAVVDYVSQQLSAVGGFETIATDAAFPNTQPDTGIIVSIADAGGLVVSGSGVSTTGRTVGGSTVTINNINSQFNSTTVAAGVAMMVESTGSGHIYNYHKATLKEADLINLSSDIDDFGNRYRVNAGEPGSNNDEGDLVFDTNANKMKVYDGSSWGEVTSTGDFKYLFLCPAGGSGAPTLNGSIATYDLREGSNSGSAASVSSAAQLLVSVNGVVQKANTGTSAPAEGFALVDANTIVFGSNLASGDSVFIVQSGSAVSIPTPGDGTVTAAKIASGAVETAKIADDAVTVAQMAVNSVDSDQYVDGSIDHVHLAADAVDGDNIADDSINSEHYVDGSIDHAHLSDDCVDGDNIADNSVGLAAMAGLARGKIIYGDASGDPAALAVGSSGQVLKSDGTDISWGTPSGTFSTAVTDSKGDVRTIVQNTQGSTYTLVATDSGKHILASGNITVPDNVFTAGQAITIVNNTAGDLTITKGTTMYNAADATNANRTLAARGVATILFTAATTSYISGAGLS